MAIEQTATNEPTQEEINAIIEESSQLELARIAGVPEPEAETIQAQNEPEAQKQPAEDKTDKVEEPSLAEQFKELMEQNKQLRKALDTTNGRFGQEVQHIKRRLDQAPTQSAPNLNEVFNRINIDDPAFAELKEEFPELAGHFVTAFQKALIREEATKQAPAVDAKPTEETQQRREAQVTEQPSDPALYEMALDTLKTKHPDFLDLAGFTTKKMATGIQSVKWKYPKFGEWLDAMPDDVREDILVGGSIDEPSAAQVLRISNIMTEYKKHAASTTETTDEPEEQKRESKPKPKVDLSKALLPSSRQSLKVAMSDDEIIEQARDAELKRIATGG